MRKCPDYTESKEQERKNQRHASSSFGQFAFSKFIRIYGSKFDQTAGCTAKVLLLIEVKLAEDSLFLWRERDRRAEP